MRKNDSRTPTDPDPSGRRSWLRKPTLLSAVIADAGGENASDCAIQDISAGGARISGSQPLLVGEQVYLLDTGFQAAYQATVVWSKSDLSGLSFVHKYAIGMGLPPHLTFLCRLLLEAKLREIGRFVARGAHEAQALIEVGLTEVYLHHMTQCANGDRDFERALLRARLLLRD